MVNFYIYAKDFSSSTDKFKFFHTNGIKTYEEFLSHVEKIKQESEVEGKPPTESKIIYLHWGDQCYEVDENETVTSYKKQEGGPMGTSPECIIYWLKSNYNISDENNKIKLLYIITDGVIDYNSADRCFMLNADMYYETVVFHAFNTHVRSIDLSVAASFFKSRCMVYRNYEMYDNVDISENFDYSKITVDNYFSEKDNLISYIKLKFIKILNYDARALKEIHKLKKLRKRLFVDLSSKLQNVTVNLDTKDKKIFLREFKNSTWYKNLTLGTQDTRMDIDKLVNTLINYIVNDQTSYSFDGLKFNTKFDTTVEEEPIANVDVNFETEQEIKFPDIILDDDKGIPVIILNELNLLDKIIFHITKDCSEVSPASFNKFKSMMDCPLYLLNDQDVSDSIGYFYTLNVYKQFLENSVTTEPRTRRYFHGGLVLVDSNEFDKYNDYILSATYFGSKKVYYNIGLFYFVLWKNSEKKEWMDRNVVERFKKYVMRRISMTICKIGLSSLPLDPPEKTSLLTALWYCVELSSYIFKNDLKYFAQERLRMYYNVAHYMIEILQHFNYDLDLHTIEKRIDLIRHVMILKRIPNYNEKVYYILEKIFKKINCFLICEIENPHNLNKLNYIKFDHKGVLSDDVVKEKVNLNEYVHFMNFTDVSGESKNGLEPIRICDKTFRPFFTIDKNKSFYSDLVKVTKKVVINNDDGKDVIKITFETIDCIQFDRILSPYNLFTNYVKTFEKYPTFQEYIDFIFKKKFYGTKVTIFPPNVYSAAERVFFSYQNIIREVEISKFVEVVKKYVSRPERIKAEGVVAFNDVELNEFITREELKVSLKRKT